MIADFEKGDIIAFGAFDYVPARKRQVYLHLGNTPERTGDLVVSYDAANDRTVLSAYYDEDDVPDGFVYLPGQVTLTAADFDF